MIEAYYFLLGFIMIVPFFYISFMMYKEKENNMIVVENYEPIAYRLRSRIKFIG